MSRFPESVVRALGRTAGAALFASVTLGPGASAQAQETGSSAVSGGAGGLGLGRAALPEEVAAWDIDIRPDGLGLPEGSGTVEEGELLFIERCAACHGDFGEGAGRWPQLSMGQGTLQARDPVKTVGSYWPYASTAFDYIHRTMPFGEAQSLTPDETYAIVAYVLNLNEIVDYDFTLGRENFTDIVMPNEDGFYFDDREMVELPVFTGVACMTDCKDEVEITMRAAVLDVTPGDGTATGAAEETGAPAAEVDTGEAAGTPGAAEEAEAELTQTDDGRAESGSELDAAAEAADHDGGGENLVEDVGSEASQDDAAREPADDVEAADIPNETAAGAGEPDRQLVAAGEDVFRRCQTCHQVGEGAVNRSGPHLNNLFGRIAGGVEEFRYSAAMVDQGAAGLVWQHDTLAAFLADPRGYVPGTKMAFPGLRSEAEIEQLLAYLRASGG